MLFLPEIVQDTAAAKGEDRWLSLKVVHGKAEPLIFNLTYYGSIKYGHNTFRDINAYLQWLGKDNPALMDEIYEYFVKANNAIEDLYSTSYFDDLKPIIYKLLECVDINSVSWWLSQENNILYPNIPHVKDDAFPDDRTYNFHEYKELVALSIVLKLLVPIWGAYEGIGRTTKPLIGKVELRMLGLLEGTSLIKSPPYIRHMLFAEAIVDQSIKEAAIMDGYSSTTLPVFCFAVSIVKKVAVTYSTWVSDSESSDDIINFVTMTHNDITNNNKKICKGPSGMKTRVGEFTGGSIEDSNTSIAENLVAKEDIAEVNKVFFDYFAEDYKRIATSLYPSIDIDALESLIQYNASRRNFIPHKVQFKLVSLVIADEVGVRSLPYTNRRQAIYLISIAQLIAHTLGFTDIAALMGGNVRTDDNGNYIYHNIKLLNSNIATSQVNALSQFYSCKIYNANDHRGKSKPKIPAELACNALAEYLARFVWELALPANMANAIELDYDEEFGGYLLRSDMRNVIADFFISIHTNVYK